MLPRLSRWVREGRFAHYVPWRFLAPLERLTVGCAYPRAADPLRYSLGSGPSSAHILFGGDLALHRWQPGSDPRAIFAGLRAVFETADARVVNLETQLTGSFPAAGTIGSPMRADPAALAVLSYLGVTAVSCANNHCLDFGVGGLAESAGALEAAGIVVSGLSGPASDTPVLTVRGIRVGLLGHTDDWRVGDPGPEGTPYPLPHEPAAVCEKIAALRAHADVVALQLHWGYEWSMYPVRSLRDLARGYVEAGADLVLCHHAHVPMGMEIWKRGVIAHGLGNLYFGAAPRSAHPFRNSSYMLRVGLSPGGLVDAEMVPIHTATNGRVDRASGRHADRILRAVAYLSARLDDTAYLEQVEQGLLAEQASTLFRDLARRLAEGDGGGARERVENLEPSRQRLLIDRLCREPGVLGAIGALLARLRDDPESLTRPATAAEIASLNRQVATYLAALRPKGRIP